MDQIFPFHIPVGDTAINLRAPSTDISGKLRLVGITGGPIFLWRGKRDTNTCKTAIADVNPDFDLAVSATSQAEMEVDSPGIETITVYSAVESIGYVQVMQEVPDSRMDRVIKELETLVTGIRELDTHVQRIPDAQQQTVSAPIHPIGQGQEPATFPAVAGH